MQWDVISQQVEGDLGAVSLSVCEVLELRFWFQLGFLTFTPGRGP